MNLSKTRYCDGKICPKKLWLATYRKELASNVNEQVLKTGTNVGELARELFENRVDIAFDFNLQNMIQETNTALKQEKINVSEASFVYDNNFCSVDILSKNGEEYEIYEVKSSTHINDIYLDDITYQYYVLVNNGLNVTSCNIVYINSSYVRRGNLNLQELFNIENVTNEVMTRVDKVDEITKNLKSVLGDSEPAKDLGIECFEPYECPFFAYCSKDLPENNVFNIRRMSNKTKFKYYDNGIIKYEDLLREDLDKKYREQIEFEINNLPDKYNLNSVNKFLDTLHYPLYFLDFETFQEAIPLYDGISPYMQIPFQYSLHVVDEFNNISHFEFLAEPDIDPRRKLAESLVKDIPMNVCTIAYNMMFEKMVIKNLAKLYPDLREHLMSIHDNMCDLMVPFKNHDYYSKNMHGSYSIKYVLPALFPDNPELNYHNLDMVHNGSEAMSSYANMGKLSIEDQQKLRYNLLKYCELDTYAMVKIWQFLINLK